MRTKQQPRRAGREPAKEPGRKVGIVLQAPEWEALRKEAERRMILPTRLAMIFVIERMRELGVAS